MSRRLVVGLSGTTGVVYGIRLLEIVRHVPDVETHLVISAAARQIIPMETSYEVSGVESLADVSYRPRDVAAAISSGSFQTTGMVIVPCSMKTLSAVALSTADTLIARAADVVLKERRRLVMVVRETPLHLGHLRLMLQATEMGAVMMPPVPAFYHQPDSIDAIINQTVNRVLDLLDICLPDDLFARWGKR